MARTILVPLDTSEYSLKALDFALSLADPGSDTLVLAHVIVDETPPRGLEEYMRAEHIQEQPTAAYEQFVRDHVLGEAEAHARARQMASVRCVVEHGNPAAVIAELADRENADMIVMGTRGLSDVQGIVLGSVAHKVNHLSARTVVTVK